MRAISQHLLLLREKYHSLNKELIYNVLNPEYVTAIIQYIITGAPLVEFIVTEIRDKQKELKPWEMLSGFFDMEQQKLERICQDTITSILDREIKDAYQLGYSIAYLSYFHAIGIFYFIHPLLIQWDERWGYIHYGDGIIANSGCGPTALAMVAAGLTGDNSITPYKIASYAGANGYYVAGSGSSWSLMTEAALNFGVAGTEIALSESSVTEELNAGHPIICSMKQGDFTTDGHFIVLTGMADGKIQVHDPNSKERSSRTWDYATLEPQIENLWSFTKL